MFRGCKILKCLLMRNETRRDLDYHLKNINLNNSNANLRVKSFVFVNDY